MKFFLGITPRSWSWALAFVVGSYVGTATDHPFRYAAVLIVTSLVGTMIEKFEF